MRIMLIKMYVKYCINIHMVLQLIQFHIGCWCSYTIIHIYMYDVYMHVCVYIYLYTCMEY